MTPRLLWLGLLVLSSFNALVYAQLGGYGPGYGGGYGGYGGYGQQPIIISRNNDDDGFRDIWPLLLILLFAGGGYGGGFGGGFGGYGGGFGGGYGGGGYGGGGYGGGGCNGGYGGGGCNNCGGCNTIPIPYPIPIPCNNPVITN